MTIKNKQQLVEHYLNLPWTYKIETTIEDGQKLFIVYVNEMPGIATDNVSIEDAMKDLKDIMTVAIEMYIDMGKPIPEPV